MSYHFLRCNILYVAILSIYTFYLNVVIYTYIGVGINTKTAKTVLKLPKLDTYLEMYPVLAFIPVYLPKLIELIGR